MRAVVQRVTQASMTVDEELLGRAGKGFLILLGVADGDTRRMAEKMADKIYRLRISEDEDRETNLSLEDVEGELLVVSQFTLYADCHKGNRSSFIKTGAPQMAESLYKHFTKRCRTHVGMVRKGRSRADMKVELLNNGSFILMLDSQKLSGEQMAGRADTGKNWHREGDAWLSAIRGCKQALMEGSGRTWQR